MTNDKSIKQAASRLIPLTAWPEYHPWPPLGGLRHLVFHAKKNGFHKVVKRISRKILIDEAAFFTWVSEQNKHVKEDSHA